MGARLGSSKEKYRTENMVLSLFMFVFSLTMVLPFIFMLSASLKTSAMVFSTPMQIIPADLHWENYENVLNHTYYLTWYWNSLKTVAFTIAFRILIVTMAAYAFARLRFPGKDILFLILLAKIMVPQDTTIVTRFLLYKNMSLLDTHWVIIIPAAFDVFFLFLLRQFFIGIPKELSESAIIDGCNHYGVYVRIILPLAKPAIITMILFTFIWTWNDFANPFIFITSMKNQLVTVGLTFFATEYGSDYAMQMAGASLIIMVPILFFAFTQRYFVQGIAHSGIKG